MSERVVHLSPEQAVAQMVPLLTNGGAKVHNATPQSITGEVVTKRAPSCLVTLILLCIMILPGVLYMIWGGSTVVEPFSITLVPGEGGTTLLAAGQGRGMKAAEYAIGNVA